jgi:hypothetical protein
MTDFDFKTIQISLLDFNKGQLDGLPKKSSVLQGLPL